MSRRAIEAFSAYGEVNLFLPALIPLLGFKSSIVYHERTKRHAGKTKYSFGKLFSLAIQAITSFSLAPIRLITGVGVLFLFVAFGIAAYMIMQAIAGDVAKWLWLLFSIWVIGATVVMSIGVVGEYVGKTYGETKRRPRYYISESLMDIR
ncbi:MAG: hypothetical protein GXZ02_03860 [Clostridiales bacterium]|nr:hypothetical protein [Clostridiales bacterium]